MQMRICRKCEGHFTYQFIEKVKFVDENSPAISSLKVLTSLLIKITPLVLFNKRHFLKNKLSCPVVIVIHGMYSFEILGFFWILKV